MANVIPGTSANDTILGSSGDDIILGYDGTDFLYGDAGNDTLNGGAGSDLMMGGLGNDTYVAENSIDDVRESAGEGIDTVWTAIDFYTLPSNVENLIMFPELVAPVTATGNELNNRMTGNYNGNTLNGLGGNDTLLGMSGPDSLNGGEGDDMLIGGGGGDTHNGGNGIDTVSYATAPAGLFAGLEDTGANTGDAAGDSYDSIENLIGSAFDDTLYGTDAANGLTGGAGNDQMVGKGGADTFDGGKGTDTVFYDASDPGIRADLLSPGTNTGDAIGDVYISIENLEGSSFDDTLLGNNNANVIRGSHYAGQSGQDQLFGRGGNDTLTGKDDNDLLVGGTGRDVMTGGSGADVFDFNAIAETGNTAATRDLIADFTHLTDDIDLSTIDANGGAAGNTAFSFLVAEGAAFTGARGQLRWFQEDLTGTANDKTVIAGDINGDGGADFQIELTGLKTLTAADFFL